MGKRYSRWKNRSQERLLQGRVQDEKKTSGLQGGVLEKLGEERREGTKKKKSSRNKIAGLKERCKARDLTKRKREGKDMYSLAKEAQPLIK